MSNPELDRTYHLKHKLKQELYLLGIEVASNLFYNINQLTPEQKLILIHILNKELK